MPREAWVLVKAVVSDAYPDHGLPGPQPPFPQPPGPVDPGYSPPWARPPVDPGYSPPWARPGPPLGMWGPNDPRPTPPIYIPIVLPPDPEHPNVPTHPIYIPVYPDNALPGSQPRPDNTLPGNQPYPDQGLPGNQPYPDNTLPRPTPSTIAKIKAAIDFWTGNLPTDPANKPTPV